MLLIIGIISFLGVGMKRKSECTNGIRLLTLLLTLFLGSSQSIVFGQGFTIPGNTSGDSNAGANAFAPPSINEPIPVPSVSEPKAAKQTSVVPTKEKQPIKKVRISKRMDMAPDRIDVPVLSADFEAFELPFLQQVLRDPFRAKKYPKTMTQATLLQNKIDKLKSDIEGSTGAQLINFKRSVFESLVDLSFFWGDVYSGKIKSDKTLQVAELRLRDLQEEIIIYGDELLASIKATSGKRNIGIQVLFVKTQFRQYYQQGKVLLDQLKSSVKGVARKRLVKLVDALYLSSSTDPLSRADGMEKLQRLAPKLSRRGSTLANLAIARNLSGVNWMGKKAWQTNPKYRQRLDLVSRLCQNFSTVEREMLLQFSVAVWKRSDDHKGRWADMPFKLHCFQKTQSAAPVIERVAIARLKQNDYSIGLKLYQEVYSLVKMLESKQSIELRVSNVFRKLYLMNGRPEPYQEFLVKVFNSARGTVHGTQIAQLHFNLIAREMDFALGDTQKPILKLRSLFKRFLESHANDPSAFLLRAKMASVLHRHGFDDQAILEYKNLSGIGLGSQRSVYAEKALEIEVGRSNWNANDAFANQDGYTREQLESLREIYKLIVSNKNPRDLLRWKYELQLAQIEMLLKNQGAAESIYKSILAKINEKTFLQKTIDVLTNLAVSSKDWKELIQIADFSKKHSLRVAPSVEGVTSLIGLKRLATQGLAEDYLLARNYPKAISTLTSLISMQSKSTGKNRNYLLLSQAYRALGKYESVVQVLDLMIANGLKDGLYEKALLENASLNLGMSNIARASELYQQVLSEFPNSDRLEEVKVTLAEIKYAIGDLEDSRKLYFEILANISPNDESFAGYAKSLVLVTKAMDDSQMLISDLRRLKDLAGTNIAVQSKIYSYIYKLAPPEVLNSTQPPKFASASGEEGQLYIVTDLKSQVAFVKAEKNSSARLSELENIILNEGEDVLTKVELLYRTTHEDYMKSCQPTYSSYCVPAMHAMARNANRITQTLEAMAIKSDSQDVAKKTEIVQMIQNDVQSLSFRAFELSQEGNTPPEWTDKVLNAKQTQWQLSGKYDFNKMGFLSLPNQLKKASSSSYAKGAE